MPEREKKKMDPPPEAVVHEEEKKLARHWRKKAGIAESEFDRLLKRPNFMASEAVTVGQLKRELTMLVWHGDPLYREEFYAAVGFRFLLTDLTYDQFYRQRWHETKEHYGLRHGCHLCAAPRRRTRVKAQA